jgi:hypothetical protein
MKKKSNKNLFIGLGVLAVAGGAYGFYKYTHTCHQSDAVKAQIAAYKAQGKNPVWDTKTCSIVV